MTKSTLFWMTNGFSVVSVLVAGALKGNIIDEDLSIILLGLVQGANSLFAYWQEKSK